MCVCESLEDCAGRNVCGDERKGTRRKKLEGERVGGGGGGAQT